MNNLNTTIDKVAMSKFKTLLQLSDDKQLCHNEMVNNPKWLKKIGRACGYKKVE